MKIKPHELWEEIEKDLTAFTRGMASKLGERIVDDAPVDSGSLKASILANIGQEKIEWSPNVTDANGEATKQRNNSIIMDANLNDQIHITVGAPYALIVEQGGSDQAPQGYVRQNIESADAVAKRVERDIRSYR